MCVAVTLWNKDSSATVFVFVRVGCLLPGDSVLDSFSVPWTLVMGKSQRTAFCATSKCPHSFQFELQPVEIVGPFIHPLNIYKPRKYLKVRKKSMHTRVRFTLLGSVSLLVFMLCVEDCDPMKHLETLKSFSWLLAADQGPSGCMLIPSFKVTARARSNNARLKCIVY